MESFYAQIAQGDWIKEMLKMSETKSTMKDMKDRQLFELTIAGHLSESFTNLRRIVFKMRINLTEPVK